MIIALFLLGLIIGGVFALIRMIAVRAGRRKAYRVAMEIQRRAARYDPLR